MNTKLSIIAAMALVTVPMAAQDTYENANIATEDLNGTARYVGMGGALEALGADISTISTNPAGIGLFRRSVASVSFGLVSQEGGKNFANGDKTNASFDQAGFVYSTRTGINSFVNFGFNYHKSRNFDYILNATGGMGADASQNKVSYNKGAAENGFVGVNSSGEVLSDYYQFSQLDYLYYNTIIYNPLETNPYGYYGADRYQLNRAHTGYIGEYDFNLSGNIKDRVYLGLTIGIHDVHYKGFSAYDEVMAANGTGIRQVKVEDNREITGTGFDVKVGAIFRPVEESPFRIGLSVATPTWYDLQTSNYTAVYVDVQDPGMLYKGRNSLGMGNTYEYKFYTPWKFGLSAGHTIGSSVAFGASYEYADYSSINNRVKDGYDAYGNSTTAADVEMNDHTQRTLKGVSTFKVGGELRPDGNMSIRLGYNYVSPAYKSEGYKDGLLGSYGVTYQSASDYVNWKCTNRITAGFGYRLDKMNIDLAYQYSQTDGTFYPYKDVIDPSNVAESCSVSNKRHQLLLILGYTF